MARSSMAALITRVRGLIGDPAGTTQNFTDDAVQDALDRYRQLVRYATLRPLPTLTAGGLLSYNEFTARVGDWEADATLFDPSYSDITSRFTVADFLTGRWVSNKATPGEVLPVYVSGQFYDPYRSGAELLEQWAAVFARKATFSSDGRSFQLGSVAQQMRDQAQNLLRKARPQVASLQRPDIAPPATGSAWQWPWGTSADLEDW